MDATNESGGEGLPGGRIRRGSELLWASWRLLAQTPALLVVPAIAGLLTGTVIALAFAVPLWSVLRATPGNPTPQVVGPPWFIFAVGTAVIGALAVVANALVIGMATIRLRGGTPTVRAAARLVRSRWRKILGWAIVSATVGLVIRALDERTGIGGRLVAAAGGLAWGLATFFVVPVLLYEPVPVMGSIKRSASLFKARWGEQVTGDVTMGLAIGLLSVPLLVTGFVVFFFAPVAGIFVLALCFGAITALSMASSGTFTAALYQYAVTGQAPLGFSAAELQGAYRPKRSRRWGFRRR